MRTEIVTDPSRIEAAWSKQYGRLVRIFADVLGKEVREIAEIGCGSGQLSSPLARYASKLQFILVDRFADTQTGSYSKRRHMALVSNLKKAKMMRRTRIVVSDYMRWIKKQGESVYDGIISSEFLPEISSAETSLLIRECYRVLKPRGVVMHSFLSPIPRNSRQKLLSVADSNPHWTRTRPKEWFSPKPQLVMKELKKSGFRGIRQVQFAFDCEGARS